MCAIRSITRTLLSSFLLFRFAVGFSVVPNRFQYCASSSVDSRSNSPVVLSVGDARGDYYGESQGSFMVKEFGTYEDLSEIVKLASLPIPERPDGIVCVAKFTSSRREDCRRTEAEYERLARDNPSSVFLRAFVEYENSDMLFAKAGIANWPTFDVFYGGNRVARIESGGNTEVQEYLDRYQFRNTKLDLFSEGAGAEKWGDSTRTGNPMATPRTTARFAPGYDWDKNKGFFDDAADKAQRSFEDSFENDWISGLGD